MMFLGYEDGSTRVVVMTVNLHKDDWYNCTQGLWMSEKLDASPIGSNISDGESKRRFKNDLYKYLSSS